MELNESTYQYINHVFAQLEGITCALASLFEKNEIEIESYHYKVLNDTYNDMRKGFVDIVYCLKNEFEDVRKFAEKSVIIMKGSEESQLYLRTSCDECENCINRLIIRCNNINQINESTENPWIPNANDEVYILFGRYKRLIDEYYLQRPVNETDIISEMFYSFYQIGIEKYERLFEQYDILFKQLGTDVEDKKKLSDEKAKKIVKRDNAIKEVAKSAGKLGITAAEAFIPAGVVSAALMSMPLAGIVPVGIMINAATAFGLIEKKDLGDVAKETISLIATVSENLEDLILLDSNESKAQNILKDEDMSKESMELISVVSAEYQQTNLENNSLSEARTLLNTNENENKERLSIAREVLKKFEILNQAIEFVDAISDDEISSSEKVILGTMIASMNSEQIALMKENGSADVLSAGLKMSNQGVKIVGNVLTHNWLSLGWNLCQIPTNTIDLIEKTVQYRKTNEIRNENTIVMSKLYEIGERWQRYEKSLLKYQTNKIQGFKTIKPKKPYWFLCNGASIIGWIAEKIDENGEDINEFIESIL